MGLLNILYVHIPGNINGDKQALQIKKVQANAQSRGRSTVPVFLVQGTITPYRSQAMPCDLVEWVKSVVDVACDWSAPR